MRVEFCRGMIRDECGNARDAEWARTPFGLMRLTDGEDESLMPFSGDLVMEEESLTELDLPGLEREGVEVIVRNILAGKYLDKPGITGKGDAVLFVLVNEAIHALEEMAEEEEPTTVE